MKCVFGATGAEENVTIKEVSTTWYAGGKGFSGGNESLGTSLRVWDKGYWMEMKTNSNGPEFPGLVTWTTTDPVVLQRLFTGSQKTVSFAVTPSTPNGPDAGKIAVDYAEVRIKYRRP